jgi:hypothetical protein
MMSALWDLPLRGLGSGADALVALFCQRKVELLAVVSDRGDPDAGEPELIR